MTARVVTDSGSYDYRKETVVYDCEEPKGYSLYDDPEGKTPASSSAGKTEISFYAIKGE